VTRFVEIAREVYVLRYPVFDVNVTLVVGDGAALLVDTLSSDRQAGELRDAVARITTAPLTVVNTHHHFDHCFGNGAVAAPPTPIWAHEETVRTLREEVDEVKRQVYGYLAPTRPELAAEVAAAGIRVPDHPVHGTATTVVGAREVLLHHPGRGHTAGDLVVRVPDADLLIAGDLVEESGPPQFHDGYPLEWPETLVGLIALTTPGTVVVPGHGAPVDPAFVRAQHADLTTLEWLIRDGHADGARADEVAAKAPFGVEVSTVAVKRGYAELAGRV